MRRGRAAGHRASRRRTTRTRRSSSTTRPPRTTGSPRSMLGEQAEADRHRHPACPASTTAAGSRSGPDGFLYATTGDAAERGRAQDRDEPRRQDPADDRRTASRRRATRSPTRWSGRYGHRNVQGIAWDAGRAAVRDRVRPEHLGRDQPDRARARTTAGRRSRAPATTERFVDPLVTWPTDESSCSGAAMVDRLLVAACLRGERLWLMELTGQGTVLGQPRDAAHRRVRPAARRRRRARRVAVDQHVQPRRSAASPRPTTTASFGWSFSGGGAGRT